MQGVTSDLMGSKCCRKKVEVDVEEELRNERRAARMQQRRLYDPRLRRHKKPVPVERANALNEAARNNRLELVKMLVEDGVFVNVTDKARAWNGYTPLMNAAANDHWKVCKYLLMKGADPDVGTMHGDTALMLAAGNGHLKTVKLLIGEQYGDAKVDLATKSGVTALSKAVHEGHLKVVKMLVEKGGADINQAAMPGHTSPLIEASASGRLDIVKYLCKQGADVQVRKDGETAVDWASKREHKNITKYLKRVDTEREVQRSARLREESRQAAVKAAEEERNRVVYTPPRPQRQRKKNPNGPARKYIRPSRRAPMVSAFE